MSNPFAFAATGQNLSMYERNGVFLNSGKGEFYDLSFLSGADSSGDGRTVAVYDITGDGMPELFVRQTGGGPLLIYRNRFPQANWLAISLRGTKSNRFGIGSKLVCEVDGRRICRELYPAVNFLSQSPAVVHLGLGDSEKVERLTIRWPSGTLQEVVDLPVNQHLLIREDAPTPTTIVPGPAAFQQAM